MGKILSTVKVADVKIVAATKKDLLEWIDERVSGNRQTFLATPYGEFLYEALRNPEFRYVLNQFDANLADGVSVQWASVFLEKRLNNKNWYFQILKAFWQAAITGSLIILKPQSNKQIIPEKITGSDFFWDLAELSEKNNWIVMLAGGFGDTAEIVRRKLLEKFPNLNIVGTSKAEVHSVIPISNDSTHLLYQIQQLKPDVLFLAIGPFKQERFLIYNREKLPVRLAIGLGGTFDYIAGKRMQPSKWIRGVGLEWLFRLLTQPKRIKRIYNATLKLIIALVKYKVYESKSYRQNVALVIISDSNKILICRRNQLKYKNEDWDAEHWQLPQGGVDTGESLERSALREASEETGLKDLRVVYVKTEVHKYTFPTGTQSLFCPEYYKGQSQSVVYLKYSGDEDAVKVDGQEFDSYAWISKDELADRVHVVRKELAQKVLENWPSKII